MTVVAMAAYLLLLLGVGVASASLLSDRRPVALPEAAGRVVALGAGNLALALFLCSLAGLAPSRAVLAGIAAGSACVVMVRVRTRGLPRVALPTAAVAARMLPIAVPAAALVAAVAFHAVAMPMLEWDAYAIWGLKAKVLLHEPLASAPAYFRDATLSYSHLDYPLGLPLLLAGAYAALGAAGEAPAKAVLPLLHAALGLLVYGGLRDRLAPGRAGVLALLLLGLPALLRWAGSGLADAPLALFHAGVLVHGSRWLDAGRREDAVLAGLFAAHATFTKNEGLALAAVALGGLFVLRVVRAPRTWLSAGIPPAVWLLASAPWLVWSRALPRTHEDYASRLGPAEVLASAGRLGDVLAVLGAELTAWTRWGGLWLLLAVLAALGFRAFREPRVAWLWAVLLADLAVYGLVLLVSPWRVETLASFALDRLLLHLAPAAVLLIGAHWAATAQDRGPQSTSRSSGGGADGSTARCASSSLSR